MKVINTQRLVLNSFSEDDFDLFISDMLTDARVVQFYYKYQGLSNIDQIRTEALKDFWEHFEESKEEHGMDIWAARETNNNEFVGWCGLLHTELTLKYGGPELQYMISGNAHGKGFATEFASGVLNYAEEKGNLNSVIATVDIPNIGSIRVLEKLEFEFVGKIEAYGSIEMYLYQKQTSKKRFQERRQNLKKINPRRSYSL